MDHPSKDSAVSCPKCKSTQIHSGMRGWSAMTGLLGSNQIMITCLKCGHTFKPGETEMPGEQSNVTMYTLVAIFVVLTLIVMGIVLS